jgi:type VI secretion system protein VasG
MTSNAGTETIAKLCADPETKPSVDGLAEALRPELLRVFKPAFLGRVTTVPYFPLDDETLRQIIKLQLGRVQQRVAENYRAVLAYTPSVIEAIASRCKEAESGARNIENVLSRGVLPELSALFLQKMSEGEAFRQVSLSLDSNGGFTYTIS